MIIFTPPHQNAPAPPTPTDEGPHQDKSTLKLAHQILPPWPTDLQPELPRGRSLDVSSADAILNDPTPVKEQRRRSLHV
jgi:hypothetical protein